MFSNALAETAASTGSPVTVAKSTTSSAVFGLFFYGLITIGFVGMVFNGIRWAVASGAGRDTSKFKSLTFKFLALWIGTFVLTIILAVFFGF